MADQFTHYRQMVRVEIEVLFKVPPQGPGQTTRQALQDEAEEIVRRDCLTTSKATISAWHGVSTSGPIYNNGIGPGAGEIPEPHILADWPEDK